MSHSIERPATADGLFLWVMHRFSERFEHEAILKGGMALRLFECPRSTTDIDYVFSPRSSKKEIEGAVREVLEEIEDATVKVTMHSKMLRAIVELDRTSIQVEVSVAEACPSEAMATAAFAREVGQVSQVVRVQARDAALAHKLAAWNERRLLRDLYDIYFLVSRVGAHPDPSELAARLARVQSQLPHLKAVRSMTTADLAEQLSAAAMSLTQADLEAELEALLPADELAGLDARIRSVLVRLAEKLTAGSSG